MLDVSAAYPTNQCVFNVSKETTKKEIVSIKGVNDNLQKMQGINLSGGQTNAIEFCQKLLSFPSLDDLLVQFEKELTI